MFAKFTTLSHTPKQSYTCTQTQRAPELTLDCVFTVTEQLLRTCCCQDFVTNSPNIRTSAKRYEGIPDKNVMLSYLQRQE